MFWSKLFTKETKCVVAKETANDTAREHAELLYHIPVTTCELHMK